MEHGPFNVCHTAVTGDPDKVWVGAVYGCSSITVAEFKVPVLKVIEIVFAVTIGNNKQGKCFTGFKIKRDRGFIGNETAARTLL